MHVKLKCLACLLVIVMIFGSVICSANQENYLTIEKLFLDNDTGKVSVSGKADKAKVTMIVNRPDASGNVQNGIPSSGDLALIYTIAETTTSEDGSFSFEFKIPIDKPGEYFVRLGVKGISFTDTDRSGSVTRLGESERANVLTQFASANASDALYTFFDNNAALKLFALPDTYSTGDGCDDDEAAFNSIVLEYRSAYYPNGISGITDISNIVDISGRINKIGTVALNSFLSDNSSLLGIDVENSEYKKYKSVIQDKLLSLMSGKTPVQKWTIIKDKFLKTVILTAFNSAKNSEVDALLKAYYTQLLINVSGDYTRVDPIEMAKAITAQATALGGFTELSQIAGVFNTTLPTLPLINSGDGDGDSGSGNGGGGGGGGGNRVYNVGGIEGLKENTATANTFTDIGGVSWASEAITALKNRGIINGMTPTQFCPNNSVTREQFVKMAVLAFGASWGDGGKDFTDVDSSAWYTPFIKKAVNAGVINGQTDSLFGIGQGITRQDVSVILYRIMKEKLSTSQSPSFKDYDTISAYAQESVCAMYGANILSGDDKGFFNPVKPCTRAEAAKLIYGALNIMEKGA